jgi:ABC-2 type transport system permease protein
MRKVWAVVRREFLARVRTRAFVIGTVLGPALMGLLIAMPVILQKRQTRAKHVVVLDAAAGEFGAQVARRLAAELRDTVAHLNPRYRIERVDAHGRLLEVRDSLVRLTGRQSEDARRIDGILALSDSALLTGKVEYYGSDVGSPSDMTHLERSLAPLVLAGRLERADATPAVVGIVDQPVDLKPQRVSDGRLTGESGEASFMLAYAMSFLLYLALLIYGMQVMTSTIEEKSSRIVEVLISSASPFELLFGKVVGVASVALVQLAIWAGTAMILTSYRASVAALMGVSPASLGALPIPTLSPQMLAVFLTFFVLGFFVYSAMYAAVGAMCNSTQEAQQAQMPVTLCVAGGLMLMFSLLSDPTGSLARTLTLVPLFAPFVVPVRFSLSAITPLELALSIATTGAGIGLIAWVAGRIYRVGILSYGKKASLGDIVRWVRTA